MEKFSRGRSEKTEYEKEQAISKDRTEPDRDSIVGSLFYFRA